MSAKAKPRKPKLNARQRAFVREYCKDFNAKQAAIRAGYSEPTAKQTGQRLLTHHDVAAAIEKKHKKTEEKADIDLAEVVKCFAWIARANVTDTVSFTKKGVVLKSSKDLPPEVLYAISEVSQSKDGSIRVKFHSKPEALKALGQHFGGFIQKHEHEHDINVRTGMDAVHDAFEKQQKRNELEAGKPN